MQVGGFHLLPKLKAPSLALLGAALLAAACFAFSHCDGGAFRLREIPHLTTLEVLDDLPGFVEAKKDALIPGGHEPYPKARNRLVEHLR